MGKVCQKNKQKLNDGYFAQFGLWTIDFANPFQRKERKIRNQSFSWLLAGTGPESKSSRMLRIMPRA